MAISQAEFVNTVIQQAPGTGMFLHLESDPTGTGVSTILGLAVYPLGNTQATDLTRVLEQVEIVRFKLRNPFPGGSGEVNLGLDVLNRAKYLDGDNNTFFYLQTPATQIQVELSEDTQTNVIISFEPFIPDLLFTNNEYNALSNSVNDQRLSSYRQVADDNKPYFNENTEELLPLPANLDLLIDGTATQAQIPDSNYTKRGWVQARYEGSTTSDLEFGGIPGFLTGRSFVGSTHVLELETNSICSLVQADRVLQDFFHTGEDTLPELKEGIPFKVEIGYQLTDTTLNNVAVPQGAVIKNNLAKLTDSLENEEIIRLISYDSSTRVLTIERGISGEPVIDVTSIVPFTRMQIFRLDKNRVVPLSDVQVWVKDNPKVLKVDRYGVVYEETACPQLVYFRPFDDLG